MGSKEWVLEQCFSHRMWGACEDFEGALPLLGKWRVGEGGRRPGRRGLLVGAHQIPNHSFTVGDKSFSDLLLVGSTAVLFLNLQILRQRRSRSSLPTITNPALVTSCISCVGE